jgi:UDP-glucose 4-epimerase
VGLALETLGLSTDDTDVQYGSESRGWKGDVPVVRIGTARIRSLGWQPTTGSAGALRISMGAMLEDLNGAAS